MSCAFDLNRDAFFSKNVFGQFGNHGRSPENGGPRSGIQARSLVGADQRLRVQDDGFVGVFSSARQSVRF
jgi:hypothetical protein